MWMEDGGSKWCVWWRMCIFDEKVCKNGVFGVFGWEVVFLGVFGWGLVILSVKMEGIHRWDNFRAKSRHLVEVRATW